MFFSLIGGLALLIYGIHLMSSNLQAYAGDKLKNILSKALSNRFKGVFVGGFVTAIIQSSSATSVMVVGFVSAGLINLTQAIAVIFGANIGTTITGQIIAFKITKFALPIIAIGAAFFFFSKKKKKILGEAIIGLGILFLGLNLMTGSTRFLQEYEFVNQTFIMFSHNPILGVLAGFLLTVLIQSSSATIGILIALASTGLIDLAAAIPIIMGDNIGTCTTALISSIASNFQAKRAALSHLLFNLAGTIIGLIMMPIYLLFIPSFGGDIARQVANTHTIFNIINVIIFLPAIPLFAKVLTKLIPSKESEEKGAIHLEKSLLKSPSIAIKAASKEINRMFDLTKQMIQLAMNDFFKQENKNGEKIQDMEDTVDTLRKGVTNYLVTLTQEKLTKNESEKIPALIQFANDLERVADHAVILNDLSLQRINENIKFSSNANKEIKEVYDIIKKMISDIQKTLKNNSRLHAKKAYHKEELINFLTDNYKESHIRRLEKGNCDIKSGVLFIDYLKNLEKIGDHLKNIADSRLGSKSQITY